MSGEFDWLVMKALEQDRSRRYETANGLAMDVRRYLAGEAVLAVPLSVGYRLPKFARQNKQPLAGAALLIGMFLALVGEFAWVASDRAAATGADGVRGRRTLAAGRHALRGQQTSRGGGGGPTGS